MHDAIRLGLVVLVFAGSWLLVEAVPRPQPPKPATVVVTSDDIFVDERANRVRVTYKVHKEGFASLAYCDFSFAEKPAGPFAPALPAGDHANPDLVDDIKNRVQFHKPPGFGPQSAALVKVSWLRASGRVAYSIKKKVHHFEDINDRVRPGARAERNIPRLSVQIPEGPIPAGGYELRGTVSGQNSIKVTIHCGSSETTLDPTVTNGIWSVIISGHPGQTCLVCVTAENDEGSVTICFEVTFE
jgi:hypothetical protein